MRSHAIVALLLLIPAVSFGNEYKSEPSTMGPSVDFDVLPPSPRLFLFLRNEEGWSGQIAATANGSPIAPKCRMASQMELITAVECWFPIETGLLVISWPHRKFPERYSATVSPLREGGWSWQAPAAACNELLERKQLAYGTKYQFSIAAPAYELASEGPTFISRGGASDLGGAPPGFAIVYDKELRPTRDRERWAALLPNGQNVSLRA